MKRPAWSTLPTAAVAAVLYASTAQAQLVSGRLLDEAGDRPVVGASVFLVDHDGEGKVRAESDSLGRFLLTAPEPGSYMIVATRLGYERAQTPLFRLEGDGVPRIDLLMRALPIGLEGLEVSVDAGAAVARELQRFGVDVDLLPAARMVTREEILVRQGARDLAAVLQWQGIPGLTIHREENSPTRGRPMPPCVMLRRGSTPRCALYIVDGVLDRGGLTFWNLAEADIEAMVVLLPAEARALHGGAASGGAVLVFTRGWVR